MEMQCPSQWMRKISDMYEDAEVMTPIMFEHLFMCAALTDTRMVTTSSQYDEVLRWANNEDTDAAVSARLTIEANKFWEQNDSWRSFAGSHFH